MFLASLGVTNQSLRINNNIYVYTNTDFFIIYKIIYIILLYDYTIFYIYVCLCMYMRKWIFEEQSMPHVFGLLLLSVQDDFILDVGL